MATEWRRRRIITEKGWQNKHTVSQIRGILSEAFINDLLIMLANSGKIKSFRQATWEEDVHQRTDFMVTLLSEGVVGIQVKSSDYGISKFHIKERKRRIERDYSLVAFAPNHLASKLREAKRLMQEINRLELSCK